MSAALQRAGQRANVNPAAGVAQADRIGQATAVEQARAVAEVAAAVQVARQFPREMARVIEDVEEACADYELAKEAFYQVQNRGTGPSVHLARELARIFGNFQYGVHELRRDDDAGESEVQAFAWDVERNTRSSRTFVNPHVRMAGGERKALVDVQDIYLSNQNTGARAVRETILSSLPKKITRYAEDLCRATLERGPGGKSLEQRREEAAEAFARGNVTRPMLEKRLGKPFATWTPADVASLVVLYESLQRGEITKDEAFPDGVGTAVRGTEIAGQAPAGPKATQTQMGRIHGLLKDRDIESDVAIRQAISTIIGRELASRRDLLRTEADKVIAELEKTGPPPPTGEQQTQLPDGDPGPAEPDGGEQ